MRRRAARAALLPCVLAAAGVLALAGAGGSSASAASARATPTPTVDPPSATPRPSSAADERQQQKEPPSVPASPGATRLERGRELFGAGCAGCHGQQGEGSPRGPSLIGAGPADTDFQVSSGRMPLNRSKAQPERKPAAYDRPDIDAIVAYVASLGPGGEPIPALPAGNLQTGRELYLENCASCHGSTGVGAALPAGRVAPSLLRIPATQVAEAARVGPGLMPQFPRSALSDQQLADIVTYVEGIPSHEDHGGNPIGAVGPVTEGFVGWFVGFGLLLVVIRLLGKRAPS